MMNYLFRRLWHPIRHSARLASASVNIGVASTATIVAIVVLSTSQCDGRNETPMENGNTGDDNRSQYPSAAMKFSSYLQNIHFIPLIPKYSFCEHATQSTQSSFGPQTPEKQGTNESHNNFEKGKLDKPSLNTKYIWSKQDVLGVGAYGTVYLATRRRTGEKVALKLISKNLTDPAAFEQEMKVMTYIRDMGSHPHLCTLHEYFHDIPRQYAVIMEYIDGGELFDHLIDNGPYSEWDASRLIGEVASALNFLHGIGVVHADLKPENILLTTPRRGDSVVKLTDFGSAQLLKSAASKIKENHNDNGNYNTEKSNWEMKDEKDDACYGAPTPAYCPPESLRGTHPIQPAVDMWALGVILFIMLVGAHPYDLDGEATVDEITQRIQDTASYSVPMNDPFVTGHLSESAKDLIQHLMHPDPDKRITALEMLQHPWIQGDTATTTVIPGSDARLSKLRRFKTKLQAKFFESAVNWSDDSNSQANFAVHPSTNPVHKGVRGQESQEDSTFYQPSLLERSYNALDTKKIFGMVNEEGGPTINMSDFHSLLSDRIQQRHFPANYVVYRQGTKGDSMYFIDSGTVEVETEDGSYAIRRRGDFFGEGALLQPDGKRSATVRCKTPVHALEISREHFEKYITNSDSALLLTLKEKDKIRRRNRVKTILRLQRNLKPLAVPYGKHFFKKGEKGDSMFILESGRVDVEVENHLVLSVFPGNVFGEHSLLTGRARNCTAKCTTVEGCVAQELSALDFQKLTTDAPHIRVTLQELHLRREFKKAIVLRLKKEFPYQNPEEAFEAADEKALGLLDRDSVAHLMRELNPDYTDDEIQEILQVLDLTTSGNVTFDEFKKVFVGDLRTSSSM